MRFKFIDSLFLNNEMTTKKKKLKIFTKDKLYTRFELLPMSNSEYKRLNSIHVMYNNILISCVLTEEGGLNNFEVIVFSKKDVYYCLKTEKMTEDEAFDYLVDNYNLTNINKFDSDNKHNFVDDLLFIHIENLVYLRDYLMANESRWREDLVNINQENLEQFYLKHKIEK